MNDLLGGKGANLAEMDALGVPVPPGFTITTDACRFYFQHGELPPDLSEEIRASLACLSQSAGRTYGDNTDPLLVSVRSGRPFPCRG